MRCKLVLVCDELRDGIEFSLTSIPDLHGAIMGHIGPARASREGCSEADHVSQLWSNAIVRPLSKFYFRRTDASDSISYHIPAAESIEIEFTSRMAVSAAIKVHHLSAIELPSFACSYMTQCSSCLPPPLSSSLALSHQHIRNQNARRLPPHPPRQCCPALGKFLSKAWLQPQPSRNRPRFFLLNMPSNACDRFCAASCRPHPSSPTNPMFTPPALMLFSSQRGISPSDVADAVSKGRATRSSKQNMNFQTKVHSNWRRLAIGSLA